MHPTNIDLHPINFFKYQIYPRLLYLKGRRCRERFSVMVDLGCIAAFAMAILLQRGIIEMLVTLLGQHR